MADAALENAMARRRYLHDRTNEIVQEINGLMEAHSKTRDELMEVEAFIRMYHQMAGTKAPDVEEQKVVEAVGVTKRVRPANPPREDVAKACVKYIREAGRPLGRHELFETLASNGIEIRGKDPEMVLSTMLWRSKNIIRRLPEGGYWPAGERSPLENEFDDLLKKVAPWTSRN
jgi:hypothetical protein